MTVDITDSSTLTMPMNIFSHISTDKPLSKRDQLINTALTLFYQKGIHAVGINEVLTQSGVAKKTLYNHFVSKEALIQACAMERDRRFMTFFTARCGNTKTIGTFIEAMFNALNDWINNKTVELGEFNGCFFVNTAAEYNDESSEIYQLCLQHKKNIKTFLIQNVNEHLADDKANEIVDLLIFLKEGVINCAHVMQDKQAAVKAKTLALSFL